MNNELQTNYTTEQTYHSIRHSIVSAQRSLSVAVNSAMVTAYWEIGEQIYKACGENDRAGYGKKLLQYLSAHLTAEFGKGFDESNLRKMRQFYCAYPIRDTLCPELSWSHYRVLMRINDEQARRFYMADITRLGEIAMPKLSDNMAPEDRRSINNYLMQLRDQMIYMMQNLDETNFSDTMRDKLVAMGLKVE